MMSKRYSIRSLILWAIWMGLSLPVMAASNQASTPQVTASLISSHSHIAAGEQITLGVKLDILPHWHTYWRNPGDSGTVTTIGWKFSQPVEAGDVIWPLPDRFKMGPIVNYGYENSVTLPSRLKLPADLKPGKPLKVEAVVDWLVCKEECIPQQVVLSLDLPVVAAGQSKKAAAPDIDQALERQPAKVSWPVRLQGSDGLLTLLVDAPELADAAVQDIWFYPYEWGKIAQSHEQLVTKTATGIAIELHAGDMPLQPGEVLEGVLIAKEQGTEPRGYLLNPKLQAVTESSPAEAGTDSLLLAILLAFAGGMVLNLMPCVFPVLSIKALSLISHSSLGRAELVRQGLIYTLGVVVSFVALALVLVLLKAGGAQVGWGFQFQSPWFVFLMAYLMFAVGLNLSGVFNIGGGISGVGSQLADKPGYWGSFFTGVLATVVATPCTAPFMAAALGFALARPAPELIVIFISLGLGLAFPYLLLTSWPGLQKALPKPGIWMEYTKQFFAFPMYAAAVWLVWVLAQQQGELAVVLVLSGFVLIALAAWIYAISRATSSTRLKFANVGVVLVVGLAIGLVTLLAETPTEALPDKQAKSLKQNWQPYSAEKLESLLAEGKPVFLNFTAAWCISCLVNEKVALSQPEVVQGFEQQGITYLKGDWTNKDAEITKILTKFGRSGVPLYVFYPAGHAGKPIELPQILTSASVLSYIQPNP
jgi:thiol:disulfide interchange protein